MVDLASHRTTGHAAFAHSRNVAGGADRNLDKTYWLILSVTLGLAIIGSTIGVVFATLPYVTETRKALHSEYVHEERNAIIQRIDPIRTLARFHAGATDTLALVFSDFDDIDRIDRLYRASFVAEDLLALRVYDFSGTPLFTTSREQNADATAWSEAADLALAEVLEKTPGGFSRSLSAPHILGDHQYLFVFEPVLHQGNFEGAVLAVINLEEIIALQRQHETLGTFSLVASDETGAAAATRDGAFFARLDGTGLDLVFEPNAAQGFLLGSSLAWKNTLFVAVAMAIPLLFLAATGRERILRPYQALQASEASLQQQKKELSELAAIAQRAKEAIIITGLDGRIRWVNPAFERLTGYVMGEIEGRKPGAFLQGPDTDADTIARIGTALAQREEIDVEILNYTKTGGTYWIRLGISLLKDPDGTPFGFMAISSDITEAIERGLALRQAHDEIERQANEDALTGLPNRRAFDLALAERGKMGANLAIIRIDLDHFKDVNDRFGHAAGDLVLERVAQILKEETRTIDMPARIGGDEFIVLLGLEHTRAEADALVRRIQERIREPIPFEGHELKVGSSFGIALGKPPETCPEEVIRAADAALYAAKDAGRNLIIHYTSDLHEQVTARRQQTEELRRALENAEFEPVYQPIIDAASGALVSVETLVRWRHPERGLLAPSAFLDHARDINILPEIDRQVMDRAFRDIGRINSHGLYVPQFSLNLTPERLADQALLKGTLEGDTAGAALTFEILESTFLEKANDDMHFAIDLLRDHGARIEIDDFGSGHASMISLMHLRPDGLKIDMQLVREAPHSRPYRMMVSSAVRLANTLGITVTAEGIETEEHRVLMTRLGCHKLQGYLFSKPLTADDLEAYARQSFLLNTKAS